MTATLATARVEWVRFFRDRAALFSTIALPIVLVLLIGLSVGQAKPQLAVGVLERSPGPLGTSLIAELEKSPALQVSVYTERADLYRDIRMGLVGGGVEVPPDGEAVQVFVQLASTGAGVVMSSVNAAAAQVGTRAVAIDVLEEQVGADQARAAVDQAISAVPAVTVATRTVGTATQADTNGFALAVPSQLILFTFLNGLLGAGTLVQARQLGVFRRMLAAPHGIGVYVSGLGLSRFLIAMLQAVILLGLGLLMFGVRLGDPVAVVTLVLVYSVIAAAAGMLLGAVVRTPGQAAAIGVPLGIVFGMLGGCMWPLSVVGPTMRVIGHLTPHAWAMDAWNQVINDGAGVTGIGTQLGVLVAVAAVLSVLAVWTLGRRARAGQ